jgi:hypothetical protein
MKPDRQVLTSRTACGIVSSGHCYALKRKGNGRPEGQDGRRSKEGAGEEPERGQEGASSQSAEAREDDWTRSRSDQHQQPRCNAFLYIAGHNDGPVRALRRSYDGRSFVVGAVAWIALGAILRCNVPVCRSGTCNVQ